MPLIEMRDVVKGGAGPALRIARLDVEPGDRLAILGLDATGGELFLNLMTGAAVPDEGTVHVAGHDTRAIATDTEWLRSLDRFGIVTDRAVLVGGLAVAANLALPLTLSVEPMADAVRQRVTELAAEAGLPAARLDAPASSLDPVERARVHLARALAVDPDLLLLEHPTAQFGAAAASAAFGETLRRAAEARRVGYVAVTGDRVFARAAGAVRMKIHAASGRLTRAGGWRSLFTAW